MSFGAAFRLKAYARRINQKMKDIFESYEQLKKLNPENELLSLIEVKVLDRESPFPEIFPKDISVTLHKGMEKYFANKNNDDPWGQYSGISPEIDNYIADLKKEIGKYNLPSNP